jgi:hypothetical protein
VPDPPTLQKASFKELNAKLDDLKSGGKVATVQFNPETLKVSFANQIVEPAGGGDKRGQPARQFVGTGTTKLSLQLVLDVTAPPHSEAGKDDVRELTQQVAYFITPQEAGKGDKGQTQLVPPGVRFLWGSFQFDGMMDSLDETLEFWSPDGKPLRATLNVALSQQKITTFFDPNKASPSSRLGVGLVGTRPLAAAAAGGSLQAMADAGGAGTSWQAVAAANRIVNPRRLDAGRLIDLSLGI